MKRPEPRRGSAYLAALLAMVLLTALAMAGVVVAQSELMIGANERHLQRLLYGAESGLASATASALARRDLAAGTLRLTYRNGGRARVRVEWSRIHPALVAPCDLCDLAPDSSYGGAYRRVVLAVTARARLDGPPSSMRGEKVLTSLLEVQPWLPPEPGSLPPGGSTALREIEL